MAQDNVDVIQSAWDAFAKGDIEGATSIVARLLDPRRCIAARWIWRRSGYSRRVA